MSAKKYILPALFFLASQINLQGQYIELRGKVVEVTGGKAKGVPNVTVKVIGEAGDVTKPDGSFSFHIPSQSDFVTVVLENCPHPMIDPNAGRVYLPPSGNLQIRVCEAENERLLAKVEELKQQVKKIENKRLLTQRQLDYLHDSLTTVILQHEEKIQSLQEDLVREGKAADELRKRVAELEKRNKELEAALIDALEEKYLRQQQTLKDIAASLNAYRSRLKDVQHELPRLSNCFLHPDGCDNFYSAIKRYSEARNKIDETHDANVESVAHNWDNRSIPRQLEDTYRYILRTIHEPVMFGMMNERVLDPLAEYSTRKKGRIAAQKETERGAEDVQKLLGPMTIELDKKTDEILKLLSETI